jgi:hypothetical protein
MMLALRCATSAAVSVGVDIRGGILCSQTAQCASSPVGSPADGRHVCGACGCVGGENEWSGRDMSWPGGLDEMGGGRGMGVVGGCRRKLYIFPEVVRPPPPLLSLSFKRFRSCAPILALAAGRLLYRNG